MVLGPIIIYELETKVKENLPSPRKESMRAVPDVNGPLTITGQPALSAEDQIIQIVLGGGTLRQL
ncbi:hypothetical protein I4100191B2_02560 [Clostridiales bacterium]